MNAILTPPDLWVGASGTATTVVVMGDQPGTDPDQAYFFTVGWQAYVTRAEDDITAGRVADFDTIEDLFADLDR
ncbi:MAG TPA: hypothetical protein VND54_10310 [Candidatus Saccharimonadales bacterium]|nr:hypothetical protein [Candidatus Saccharimonadales bacterium]